MALVDSLALILEGIYFNQVVHVPSTPWLKCFDSMIRNAINKS